MKFLIIASTEDLPPCRQVIAFSLQLSRRRQEVVKDVRSLCPAAHRPCPRRFVRLLAQEAQTSKEIAVENGPFAAESPGEGKRLTIVKLRCK